MIGRQSLWSAPACSALSVQSLEMAIPATLESGGNLRLGRFLLQFGILTFFCIALPPISSFVTLDDMYICAYYQ
jgi:hypothetical protein